MCWKNFLNWFNQSPVPVPDPIPDPVGKKKIALLFAINNYPGSGSDLNGCINDQLDLEKKLNTQFPGFVIRKFQDSEVTRSRFISEVYTAISQLQSEDTLLIHYSGHGTQLLDKHGDEEDGYDEAIYLYDGTVIDDDIGDSLKAIPEGATVILMFDSCFSGTITRVPIRNRFIPNRNVPRTVKKRVRVLPWDMKWVVFSGCGEQQTSADAYLDGRYNGAFTYYALKTLTPGITYQEWLTAIRQYLPSHDFDQIPTLEGKNDLFSKRVFT